LLPDIPATVLLTSLADYFGGVIDKDKVGTEVDAEKDATGLEGSRSISTPLGTGNSSDLILYVLCVLLMGLDGEKPGDVEVGDPTPILRRAFSAAADLDSRCIRAVDGDTGGPLLAQQPQLEPHIRLRMDG
jgi:hypothetical protein